MNPFVQFWRHWVRFWFSPTDPTTMAFIRIITGTLVLYVHIAYCFDLVNFFGKDGWVTLDTVNKQRREEPSIPSSLGWEFDEKNESTVLPDPPHRRKVFADWIRSLPYDNKPELWKKLRFLVQADATFKMNGHPGYPEYIIREAVYYCKDKVDPEPTRTKKFIADGLSLPESLQKYKAEKPKEYEVFAEDLYQFYTTLPQGSEPKAKTNRGYILDHFNDMPNFFREPDRAFVMQASFRDNLLRFIDFLSTQPETERNLHIDYLENWQFEKRFAYREGFPIFSIWFHVYDPVEMYVIHGFILVIMFMYAIGLYTRVTSVLTWLCAVSFLHRNQQVLFGQDVMMNILLIYTMIAHSGGTLSVDRWLAKRKIRRAIAANGGKATPEMQAYLDCPPPSYASGFGQRLLQVHFCFIYMAAGLSKLKGPAWWNHNAFWDTIANPEFTLIHYESYQSLLRMFLESRPLYAVAAGIAIIFTIFTEIALPFLVWTRLRPYIVIMGFMLHAGVGTFMGLMVFSLLMMTMLVSYIPGSAIRAQLWPKK